VRLATEGGLSAGEASARLALPKSTLENWVEAAKKGKLGEIGKSHRPLTEEAFPSFTRRSGMDPEIREAIVGHSEREKSVIERYGSIGDQEPIRAVDSRTSDNGEAKKSVQNVYKRACTKKIRKRLPKLSS
jgi:transposase-like protein